MKLRLKEIDKKWKEYALAGCVCILFFLFLTNLGVFGGIIASVFRTLRPVVIGFIIAYIVNPLAVFFQTKVFYEMKNERAKWGVSIALTLVIFILIIALLVVSLIPQVVSSIASLADNYPTYVSELEKFINNSDNPIFKIPAVASLLEVLSSEYGLITKIGTLLKDNASLIIAKTTVIGAAAWNIVIGIIFAIYFLVAKRGIQNGTSNLCKLLFSPMRYLRFSSLMAKFNAIFSKYIACELLDSIIVLLINYVFMLVSGMPNAIFVSVIVGVTNLAPTFGPIVGAVLGAFVLILIKPTAVIPFLVFTLVLQTCDGYVIKPRLFGGALNVPGVLILIAIIVFGKLMGVSGMLLAIPFAAIIVYIYNEAIIPYLKQRRERKNLPLVSE